MQRFEARAWSQFESEMLAHALDFAPWLGQALGAQGLRPAVSAALKRAVGLGFEQRGPLRLWLEATLLYGSHFDTDPLHASLAAALHGPGTAMDRAHRLFQAVLAEQDALGVADGRQQQAVLDGLAWWAATQPPEGSWNGLDAGLADALAQAHPLRARHVGVGALAALVRQARASAMALPAPTPHDVAWLALVMFGLGHGCLRDPLYPWVARAWAHADHGEPPSRARRLAQAARDGVVAVPMPPPPTGRREDRPADLRQTKARAAAR